MVGLGGEGTGAAAGRGGVEAAVGGLFEAVDPGVLAAGESVGEGFFEADLLFVDSVWIARFFSCGIGAVTEG